jgi:hypothetical protein
LSELDQGLPGELVEHEVEEQPAPVLLAEGVGHERGHVRLRVEPPQVVLDQFGQGGEGQWEVVLAASVIATVPLPVIFFLGQRYFVERIATTGRKG